jgi:hypothetical protein
MERKRLRQAAPTLVAQDEPLLQDAIVWSRVQDLQELDDELEKMEHALGSLLALHQKIHARVRVELADASQMARSTRAIEPSMQRSFGFYIGQAVEKLKEWTWDA